MSAPDSLLLGIDLQPVFLAAIAAGPTVLRRCQFALEAATGLGIPAVFTEQLPGKLGRTAPELMAARPNLETHAKDSFSALGDEAITRRLQEIGADHLLICGV